MLVDRLAEHFTLHKEGRKPIISPLAGTFQELAQQLSPEPGQEHTELCSPLPSQEAHKEV